MSHVQPGQIARFVYRLGSANLPTGSLVEVRERNARYTMGLEGLGEAWNCRALADGSLHALWDVHLRPVHPLELLALQAPE